MKTVLEYIFRFILGFSIACVPLCYFRDFLDPSHSPIFLILSFSYLGLYIIHFFRTKNVSFSIDFIFILLTLYFILGIISYFNFDKNSESLLELYRILFLVISFLFFKKMMSEVTTYRDIILYSLILSGFLYAIFGWIDLIVLYNNKDIHKGLYSISAHIGHKNLMSIYLLLCFPLMYFVYVKTSNKYVKTLLFILFLIEAILILCSMSRVGYIGLFIFVGMIHYIYFRKYKWAFRSILIYLSSLLILGALMFLTPYGKTIYKRALSIVTQSKERDENNQSIQERKILWAKTYELIKEHPFNGLGLGQWKFHIGSKDINGTRSKFGNIIFQQPHNDFLWVWSENGLFSFIIYVLLFGFPIVMLVKYREIHKEDTEGQMLLMAFVLYFIVSQFDFPKERPALLQFFGFYLALFSIWNSRNAMNTVFKSRVLAMSSVLLILICGVFFSKRVLGEFVLSDLMQARKKKDYYKMITLSHTIKSQNIQYDQTSTPIDFYKGEANFLLGNYFDAKQDLINSRTANPYHLYTWNNLGGVYSQLERKDSAVICWHQALKISSDFPEPRVNLAYYFLSKKDMKKAIEILHFNIEDESSKLYESSLVDILTQYIKSLNLNGLNEIERKELTVILNNKSRLMWLYKTYTKNNNSFEIELMKDINYSILMSHKN